ncbi:TELO2-interacting protein 1 homolog isoform X2 [Maylandia zebra]|uniref:TELO2-interacting protein 1 homolog isoform X2 n=1 Tax=Maylandia zebra TaxID=106582 RepID=UPI00403C6747
MKALARWFPSTCSGTSKSASSRQSSSDQEDLSIGQFLLNYCKQKELAESFGIEDDDTEDREVPPTECEDVEDIGSPDVKAELPSHLSITKDVTERCIHLLSDPSLRLRLKGSFCKTVGVWY